MLEPLLQREKLAPGVLDGEGCVFEMQQFVANLISESKCAVRWVYPGVLGSHSEQAYEGLLFYLLNKLDLQYYADN